MVRTLYFIAFLLSVNQGLAQRQGLDSLLKALNGHSLEDTIRLNLLNEIAYTYADSDPEQGITTAAQAIRLAKKINHPAKLAKAYNYQAINLSRKGEDSLALQLHQAALSIYQELEDGHGAGMTLQNMGIIYYGLSEYYRALEHHQEALAVFERAGNRRGVANAVNSIGINYMALSDYPKAMDYYLKAFRLYEEAGNQLGMANALTNLGIVYKNLSKYPKALEYHTKALKLFEQVANQQGMVNALGNMGIVYDLQHNPSRAVACYQKALAISEAAGNRRGVASNITNLGITYAALGDYPKAWDYFHRSLALYQQLGAKDNQGIVLNHLGILLRQAPDGFLIGKGVAPQERYAKAAEYHLESLQQAKESGSLNTQATAWQNLDETYEAQQDYPRALQAYKQYIALRDSIINEEKTEEIARKEIQFEYDKKSALAVAEIKRQRIIKNATMAGTALLLLAALSSFAFYKRRQDAEQQRQEAEFQVQVSDTEMKALRAQMNPHFIFNSLNSISDYIARHDNKAADYYLVKFAKVMRLILEHSEQKQIRLSDELKVLELYMQLESLRLNNKFTYEIRVDEAIDQDVTLIPPLILQPFVENSIWHGLSTKQGEGKILIHIKREDEMLHCIVEDNGVGRRKSATIMAEPAPADKKSVGMKITKARIDIINKIKKSNAAVELSDLAEGLRVEVKLPLELLF